MSPRDDTNPKSEAPKKRMKSERGTSSGTPAVEYRKQPPLKILPEGRIKEERLERNTKIPLAVRATPKPEKGGEGKNLAL